MNSSNLGRQVLMADQIYRMLTGDVTDLPPKESNIVRIFTSSTFTGLSK